MEGITLKVPDTGASAPPTNDSSPSTTPKLSVTSPPPDIDLCVTPPLEDGMTLVVPSEVPESPKKSSRTSWENKNFAPFDLTADKTTCPAANYSKTTVHVQEGGFLGEPMLWIKHDDGKGSIAKPGSPKLTLNAHDNVPAVSPTVAVSGGDSAPNTLAKLLHATTPAPTATTPPKITTTPPEIDKVLASPTSTTTTSLSPSSSPRRPGTPTISVSVMDDDDVMRDKFALDTAATPSTPTNNNSSRESSPLLSKRGDIDSPKQAGSPQNQPRHTLSPTIQPGKLHLPAHLGLSATAAAGYSSDDNSPVISHTLAFEAPPPFNSAALSAAANRHSWSPANKSGGGVSDRSNSAGTLQFSPSSSPESKPRRLSTSAASPTMKHLALPGDLSAESMTEMQKVIQSLQASRPSVPREIRLQSRLSLEEDAKNNASTNTTPISTSTTMTPTTPDPATAGPQSPVRTRTSSSLSASSAASPVAEGNTTPRGAAATTTTATAVDNASAPLIPHLLSLAFGGNTHSPTDDGEWATTLDHTRIALIFISLCFVSVFPTVFVLVHMLGVGLDLVHARYLAPPPTHDDSDTSSSTTVRVIARTTPLTRFLATRFSTPVLLLRIATAISASAHGDEWSVMSAVGVPALCACLTLLVGSAWTGVLASILCKTFRGFPVVPVALQYHAAGATPATGAAATAQAAQNEPIGRVLSVLAFALHRLRTNSRARTLALALHEMFLCIWLLRLTAFSCAHGAQCGLITQLLVLSSWLGTLPFFVLVTIANGVHLVCAVRALSRVGIERLDKLKHQ